MSPRHEARDAGADAVADPLDEQSTGPIAGIGPAILGEQTGGAIPWSDLTMPLPALTLPPVPGDGRPDLAVASAPAVGAPPRPARHAAADGPPVAPVHRDPLDDAATAVIPAVPATATEPAPSLPVTVTVTETETATGAGSLLRAANKVALGTLVSRLTGFVRTVAVAAALGSGLLFDAYNIANTLPNQVYELLVGGVLTSVIVPLLVRSQKEAKERGTDPNEYPQRLFSLAVVGLTGATVLAIIVAPLLIVPLGIGFDRPNHAVATFLLALFLPQMIFYGIGALGGALLNTRDRYAAPAWAPVANNLIVTALAIYLLVVAFRSTDPDVDTISGGQILVVGLGTTLGIVVQALVLVPAWRRAGFRWKWRLQWKGVGLGELGSLGGWVLLYVVLGQVGYSVAVWVAGHFGDPRGGTQSTLVLAQILFQLPYGILGVSLLTAIMPRMSRAAADGDTEQVKGLLATGTRLSGLALLPVSAVMVFSVPLTLLIFHVGNYSADKAADVGLTLALAGFGLLPFAMTLLQLRVFYAAKDARTPTLIMCGIVGVRVVLSLACIPLPDQYLAAGLSVANSASFVAGAVLGEVLLRRRFGSLGTGRVVADLGRIAAAAVIGLLVAVPVCVVLVRAFTSAGLSLGALGPTTMQQLTAWQLLVVLAVAAVVTLVVYVAVTYALKIPEIRRLVGARRRRPGRS